ncbi:efflux transporter, RND family, MFP subunit [Cardiobacterium hominis ATCC 15826]|uniref:Efflux transporter, RND family, MFP subunit n=2 Tax=Cardiobacterium hominis TaxID=2718 RepID=C8N9C1_CARH6|nr:efflux transporter, RND family, MFP subunit [Cardiobacterium hominis ATCC 15826]
MAQYSKVSGLTYNAVYNTRFFLQVYEEIMMEIRVRFLAFALSAATLFAPAVAQEKQGGEKKEGNAPPAAAQQQKPPPAKVMVVKPQTVIVTENLPARLEASREAVIQPQVSGIVQKRLFEEGSLVRAGQQLYQIDDAVYQANLQSAKAQLSLAQANKALAQSTANRYAPLVKEKAVSRQTYDQALTEVKVASANIMVAEAAIKQAEINVQYAKVLAPISGVIGKSNVSEGALVAPGSTANMAKIQQLDPLYVNITQSAANLMRIKKEFQSGALKGVDFTVQITLDDGTPYPHKGRMLFADQTVDASTGELLLRAEVPNPDGLLLPGLYVRADIPQSQFHNAYLVPQAAVTRGKTDTLRVVAEDGSFAPREVKIAGTQKNQWIITDGLKPGERVMIDTLSQLMGGATHITPVVVNADGQPAAAPATAAEGKPADAAKPASAQ